MCTFSHHVADVHSSAFTFVYTVQCLSNATGSIKSELTQRDAHVPMPRLLHCTQWRRNRGFRRYNEPGPKAPGGPESVAKKLYSRKGHLSGWEHKKHQNPWRWRLTPLPRPGSRPSCPKAPPPISALRTSSWGNWGSPGYCWTRAPQSLATPLTQSWTPTVSGVTVIIGAITARS